MAILITTLRVAGATVLIDAFKARDFLATVDCERVTYTIMVPAMYHLCMLVPDLSGFDLASWRVGGFGGAPMPAATIAHLAAALPSLAMSNIYGATETTSPVSLLAPDELLAHADTVGRLLPCVDAVVIDAEDRELAPGERGELLMAGPMIIPGYWNNAPADAASFAGGFWRSGDIASIDAHGYLRIHDRAKDVINRGGYKIYCVEVENVIADHPGTIECAVVGYPDAVLGERVAAFVRSSDGAGASAAALRDHCAARLSDYKLPEIMMLVDTPLPRNANGKIVKAVLRELLRGAR